MCVFPLSGLLSAKLNKSPFTVSYITLTHTHKTHQVTLTYTDTYCIHTTTFTYTDPCVHTHTRTFHTSLWANEAEWQTWARDKWYNDIQAWLVSRVEREEEEQKEEDEEEEGQSSGSSEYRNYSSSSHTVAAHYVQTRAWQCAERERERWRGTGGSWRADIMTNHTLLSHCHLLSQHLTLRPQPASHSLFLSFTPSLTSFPPLSRPPCIRLSRQRWVAFRERVHSFALTIALSSPVKAREQHGPLGMSQND